MKIAVVATYDVTNIKNWSGIACNIFNMLSTHFDVTPIKINFKRPIKSWIEGFAYNRILKKRYFVTFDKSVYRKSRKVIKAQMVGNYDVILTFDYFLIPALAPYAKDILLFTDATFDNLLNYYDYRTNLSPRNIKGGHSLQNEAFSVLTYAFLTSDWARNSAILTYGAKPSQIIQIRYGSNLTMTLDEADFETVVYNRLNDKIIRLFFPMVYWERKGGDYVVKIVQKLNALGYKCELTVVGKMPENVNREHIDFLGYLDKNNQESQQLMCEKFKQNHFLIMPSKADCTPVVFAEANSFGLPVISTKTGGVESVVKDTFDNGVTFTLDESYIDKVVQYITKTLNSKDRYKELCRNSLNAYNRYFKWSICEEILVKSIQSLRQGENKF